MTWSIMRRKRNPLRRASDRIEAATTFLVIMTMLLLVPWVGWRTAETTYRNEVRASAPDRQRRFHVAAVLLADAVLPRAEAGADGQPAPTTVPAPVRWTGPDGAVHTGMAPASVGSRERSTVEIWVDENGSVVDPKDHLNPALDAVVLALAAMVGLGAGLFSAYRIVVWRLNRRRLRSWQAQWLVVEPRWSRR